MNYFKSVEVSDTYERYPDEAREQLLLLRQLILETAHEIGIEDLQETLKWGEPSYVTKNGSTIRIAWRKSFPKEVAMLFHCKTTLVDTFKEIYRDQFRF